MEHELRTEALATQRANEPFGPAQKRKEFPEPQPEQDPRPWVPNNKQAAYLRFGNPARGQAVMYVRIEADMTKFTEAVRKLGESLTKAMQPVLDFAKEHESILQQIATNFEVPVDSLKVEVHCPRDTDGDGHCGQRGCPMCGGP